ncbi:hypothetical protein [uncultured Lutibacter sp.]|nr:hypothetical protein [uncultured Lutibacter sp.]
MEKKETLKNEKNTEGIKKNINIKINFSTTQEEYPKHIKGLFNSLGI